METTKTWLDEVETYLTGIFPRVRGWCEPGLWQAIQPIATTMNQLGATGPIAEIGVYHGKFFLGLVKTMQAPENNYAFDVFDMQEFNYDNAGDGDLAKFRANLTLGEIPESAYEIVRTDSTWLNEDDFSALRARTGGFSMFSIDGAHTVEHTMNDMRVAMALTRPSGVIFVDDFLNPFWGGVVEAVSKLYLLQTPQFVPVAFICNKLILAHISYHQRYFDAIRMFVRTNFPKTRMKPVRRYGYTTLAIVPHEAEERVVVRPD